MFKLVNNDQLGHILAKYNLKVTLHMFHVLLTNNRKKTSCIVHVQLSNVAKIDSDILVLLVALKLMMMFQKN